MAVSTAAVVQAQRRSGTRRTSLTKPTLILNPEERKRVKAEVEALSRRKKYRLLLEKYDEDNTGKLNKVEMMKVLTDLEEVGPWVSGEGMAPTEAELESLLKIAGPESSWMGFSVDELDERELEIAVATWVAYKDNRYFLEKAFSRFDTTNSGYLPPAHLKDYMRMLSGTEVADGDVAGVLRTAGEATGDLKKLDTMMAVLEWYSVQSMRDCSVAEKEEEPEGSPPAKPPPPEAGKPPCCVAM